jgi:predicted lipoprotein with Yx(FWY)xxD motif
MSVTMKGILSKSETADSIIREVVNAIDVQWPALHVSRSAEASTTHDWNSFSCNNRKCRCTHTGQPIVTFVADRTA